MRRIGKLDDWLGGGALFLCFALVCFQVGGRLLGASVSWTDELSRYLIIVATYFGAAAAVRAREHIRVELLLDRLPDYYRSSAEAAIDLLCALYTGTVAAIGFRWVRDTQELGLISAESSLVVPIWVFQAVIPIGFGIMTVRLLGHAWRDARGGRPPPPTDGPVPIH